MVLEAGGILPIGLGYTITPSYAFQMTSVVEMDVLEKQMHSCTLLSVPLITRMVLFVCLMVRVGDWGEMDNCRDVSTVRIAAWQPSHQQQSEHWTNARALSIIHRNAPSAEPGGKYRLCGAKRVRRVEGETGDTLILRGVYSIYYRMSVFWFNQEPRRLWSHSLNVHLFISVDYYSIMHHTVGF